MAQYVSFHKSLQKSASTEVSFLVEVSKEDARSTTSKNLSFIQNQTGLEPLKSNSAQIENTQVTDVAYTYPRLSVTREKKERRQSRENR